MDDNMKSLDSQKKWIYCLLFVVLSLIITEIIMFIDWSLVVAIVLVICGVWFFGFKDISEDNTNHSELYYLDFMNSKVELSKHFNFNGEKYRDIKVTTEQIQKLVGACHPYNAQPVFITTSDFNRFAVDEARLSNVILINGERLVELIKKQILGVGVNLSQGTSK